MNKTKKYLIIFLSFCFIFIISVGIKQTVFPSQSKSQTVDIQEEKKSSSKKDDEASQDKQETENKTDEKAEETTEQETTKTNEDSSTQKSKAVTQKQETTHTGQSQENSTTDTSQQPSSGSQSNDQKPVETISYNMVIAGKGNYVLQKNIIIHDGQTVYDVLKGITNQYHIEFEAVESQYGMYVINIGGLKAANYGGGMNNGWVYTVNGISPACSAEKYVLKAGDQIKWTYLY